MFGPLTHPDRRTWKTLMYRRGDNLCLESANPYRRLWDRRDVAKSWD